MPEQKAPFSDEFKQYVVLLVKLHQLIRAGRGDDAEADEVRDQMDAPWEAMSRWEIDTADALSIDLYSIGEDRVPEGAVNDQDSLRFANAMESGDFLQALEVIRENARHLPTPDVALIRGTCWKQLQQDAVATEFFRETLRLSPHNSVAIAVILQNLVVMQRLAEAEAMALKLFTVEDDPLNRIIAAKTVLIASDFSSNPSVAMRAEREILDAIVRIPPTEDHFVRDQIKFALLALTMFLEATGRIHDAVSMCDRALSLDFSDPYAHELKGALMVKSNPDSASKNIRRQLSAYFDVQTQAALHLATSLN